MCARYTVFTEGEILEMRQIIAEVSRRFGGEAVKTGDIFPSFSAPVLILRDNRLTPQPASFGFPKWDGKGVIVNARSESALQKPMFSKPLLTRRCVIPSTGFYEWAPASMFSPQLSLFPTEEKPTGKSPKVNLFFRRSDGPMLYMAGMMNTVAGSDGKEKDAFVILTTEANASMKPFHDRMPVILAANECVDWIRSEAFMHEVLARECAGLIWEKAG